MAHSHIRFIQIDQNRYRIPVKVLAELGVSLQRTGSTQQLERAMSVLRTLFTLAPDLVEDLFWIQGQADCTGNVSEPMEEYELDRDSAVW